MAEMLTKLWSAIGGLMLAYTMLQNFFPHEITTPIKHYSKKLLNFFYPYITINFPEYEADDAFQRSSSYASIKRYLNARSASQAKHLQASVAPDSEAVVLAMAPNSSEEVADVFENIKLWWSSGETQPSSHTITFGPREAEKRFFSLTFHIRHRDAICDRYLKHVLEQGKEIAVMERKRKLFTNNRDNEGGGGPNFGRRRSLWSEVVFDHPATFETLAMDPEKKKGIIDDLTNFSESKDYYKSVGKAWKRGYLLYGPPGTGKSTMIAAMANLLQYDVYDLELTAVKDNTELRRLLIDTSGKSIMVIEDIDCSLVVTGQREKKERDEKKEEEEKDPMKKMMMMGKERKESEVTLSGLLNFIDGLWSACGGERIIVFTTNYVEKLDAALIRRGRMDQHIELSYCGFEAFRVLAKNYLGLEEHDLFGRIEELLGETKMTPADVAENLMPKVKGEDKDGCLMRLVGALEEAKVKAEEEEKVMAQKLAEDEEEKKKKAEEEEEEKKENGVAEIQG
ncbi:AAA-ATPase ASD, mitochondrial-like [Salvia hispanica]|uniref:AAA-ATPase ASD, mitochondrial-like n=1 Tax=Salvia hispanica TaxID=49212 RepID=UPI0020092B20|nr:AAA-ATPase ASD, mitochondrial-like [Salvia hispanica]